MLCISYSNSQTLEPGVTYTTPDITNNSAWVGAVYQQNLTCWKSGDPGYCGPQPIVRPDGNINFSYGSSYTFQQHNPSTFLPQTTGLQVSGFNFSFTAKNGNGWDDGRTDQLTALVRFWDTTGGRGVNNVLYRTEYALNYKFDWRTFNYSETFTQPLNATSIGTVQYGFIGRDNNGWLGPYGPEINNVQFNLRYSVDPCVANPLHAPTCSGYLAALAQLAPKPVPQPAAEPIAAAVQPVAEQTAAAQQATQQTAPQPTATTTTAPVVVSAMPTAAPTPAASERASSGGGNLSLALNLISRNAERERAFQQQAVASATAEAQAAGDRALTVGSAASTSSNSASLSSETGSSTQVTQSAQTSTQTQQSTAAVTTVQAVTTNTQQQATQQVAAQQLLAPVTQELQQTRQTQSFGTQTQTSQELDLPQQLAGFVADSSNPLRDMFLPPPPSAQPQAESRPVNRSVENNSAAGGVGLEGLIVVPQNYASYTQLVLRDAPGYPPREVYRNQTVVDNRQALRGLGSDRKHQDLVNLQYK